MADSSPWLTVVTVVKDDVTGMLATVGSIIEQDLDGVEYVVVDGSSDRAEVPATLPEALEAKYSWADPRGIYPAMNVGLSHAQGRFVYFANAGDELLPGVVARVRSLLTPAQLVWAFGGVDFYRTGEKDPVHEPEWDYSTEIGHFLARRRFPPHQGVFMLRDELSRQGGFDESYRIAADYLSILRAGQVAAPLALDFTIARFTTGGASTANWRAGLREFHRARLEALDLHGLDRVREGWLTADTWARTAVYRGILAR